ncbi:hypothetical protein BYT27DRAFT_7197590 [Phlegmacium glaucopus]|nr:hypothetical protein BYT27DRAFT_7197590 [Phlegmacium glaucopus]
MGNLREHTSNVFRDFSCWTLENSTRLENGSDGLTYTVFQQKFKPCRPADLRLPQVTEQHPGSPLAIGSDRTKKTMKKRKAVFASEIGKVGKKFV